jgi:hypothetical protein
MCYYNILFSKAKAENNILSIGNKAGFIIKEGERDPREVLPKNKHGRPSKKLKNALFGTANTTFRVETSIRPGKIFAVKVFQKNVSLETLGGLYIDCRDTYESNIIVLNELKRALSRPDLELSDFRATMRNYRFKLRGSREVKINAIPELIEILRSEGWDISCLLNIDQYPSAILNIDAPNHTSKKKKLTVKIFQSSKINIDSTIYYEEHLCHWYKFFNQFFIRFEKELLYQPCLEEQYDSDYYYNELGVTPPPEELVL